MLSLAVAPTGAVSATVQHSHAHTARACANADAGALSTPLGRVRIAVVCLVNQQRTLHRLPPLRADGRLDHSAQGWSNAMVRLGLFTHGANFTQRLDAVGYFWSDAGENIATGFTTPRQVVDAWMASTGHCENILSPDFADVGTGVSTIPLGEYLPATWTQDFGLWMGHRQPSHNSAAARGCPYRVS